MLATSKSGLFRGHTHLTTGTYDPTLCRPNASESDNYSEGYQYRG